MKVAKNFIINVLLTQALILLLSTSISFSQTTVCQRITAGIDDVEEQANGVMDTNSSDLELINNTFDQVVGLRFNNINIPQGANISGARIQFAADEVKTGVANLIIKGAATDNASAFTNTAYNLSNRTTTSSAVSWNPAAWNNIGDAGAAQQTPDISQIINEITSRTGYAQGNSIVIIISGSGVRTAESFEGSQSLAAELCITYWPCGIGLADSDNDGVCDDTDICNGHNDNTDIDNDGIPDGCDNCIDVNNNSICDDVDPAFLKKVVINEINYRSTDVQKDIDFIELYNADNTAVDLTGWALVDGVHYKFPAGTILNVGAYLVVAANPSDCQSELGFSGAYGPYDGSLSSKGDAVALKDNFFNTVDKVDYDSWKEWPSIRFDDYKTTGTDGDGNTIYMNNKVAKSIQKINPGLPGKHGGSWQGYTPSPKARNTGVYNSNPNNIPVVNRVSKSPDKPTSGQQVRVLTELENLENIPGNVTVNLEYQTVNAGSYVRKSSSAYSSNWSVISMLDNGAGVDSIANNGVYSAIIPASVQVNRRLIRYRIRVQTSNGFNELFPRQEHSASNYAYYVYNGQSSFNGYSFSQLSELQSVQLIASSTDIVNYIEGDTHNGIDYPGEGTLVYNGKVYDHVRFRARGKGSRHVRLKKNIKIDLNSEQKISIKNDWGEAYDEERSKLSLSGTWVNDANSHGLTESLIYKVAELSGAFNKYVDYCQLRIVDNASEGGNSGDFWGLYLIQEDWGGTMLKEHNMPDGNIYSYKGWQIAYEGGEGPYGANNSTYTSWNSNIGNSQDGCSNCAVPTQSQSFYKNNVHFDYYYADWVANEIIGNSETNYPGQHSYREYYDPVAQKWIPQCGDYDETFGMPHNGNVAYLRSSSLTERAANQPLKPQISSYNTYGIEFRSHLISTLDLLFNTEQQNHLINSETAKIFKSNGTNWTNLDYSRWSGQQDLRGFSMNYSNYQTDVINWYSSWFNSRESYLRNTAFSDNNIPNRPTISYSGPSSKALNKLSFNCSAFSDPQGNNTFAAMEWRVGEWSNPSNPIYLNDEEPKYEIETVWRSGEVGNSNTSITIPAQANLKEGRTYKIRARYKDNTGRWSRWSSAVTVIPKASDAAANYNLVINEILYNPAENCGVEFIELYNNGNSTINLNDFKFTNGVDYDFPVGSTIAAKTYLVLTQDSVEFACKYGFSPFGDYKNSLSNAGEKLVLKGPYRTVVDSLTYFDHNPWPTEADGEGSSLSLVDADFDNSLPASWTASVDKCGTPGIENNLCGTMVNNAFTANISCAGYSDGFISNSVLGGTAPLTYAWSNGQTGASLTDLDAGTYTVTIKDAYQCELVDVFQITEPAPIVVNLIKNNETYFQGSNGTAAVNPVGGTGTYSYSWSNGATGQSVNNLQPGSYSVTVSDLFACSTTETFNISAIDCSDLNLTVTATDITALQANDATATAAVTGGTMPYTYSWSNGAGTSNINNLPPGSYTVTVTDAKGCPASQTANILAVDCSSLNVAVSKTDENYFEANDGSAAAIVTGGVSPYAYSWSNGASTSTINNLNPDTYTLQVNDALNCVFTETVNILAIDCGSITASISKTDQTYFQANDGTASLNVSGGVSPYTYSWSNGATAASVNNLAPGAYSVTIEDAVGCSSLQTVNIEAIVCGNLSAELTTTNQTYYKQNDGMASVFVIGGTNPYTYAWSNGGSAAVINNLAPDDYSIVVTDAVGCIASQSFTISTIDCSSFEVSVSSTDETGLNANDGSASASVIAGVSPFTYSWSSGATVATIINLEPGSYSVDVTDAIGCTVTETANVLGTDCAGFSLSVSAEPETSFEANDATATAAINGGTAPFSYSWSNGDTTAAIINLIPGDYTITAVDSVGCSDMQTVFIGCTENYTNIDNNILYSGIEQVSDYIISNGIVKPDSLVTYRAGNLIELEINFEVMQGADFEASIEDCK